MSVYLFAHVNTSAKFLFQKNDPRREAVGCVSRVSDKTHGGVHMLVHVRVYLTHLMTANSLDLRPD